MRSDEEKKAPRSPREARLETRTVESKKARRDASDWILHREDGLKVLDMALSIKTFVNRIYMQVPIPKYMYR